MMLSEKMSVGVPVTEPMPQLVFNEFYAVGIARAILDA